MGNYRSYTTSRWRLVVNTREPCRFPVINNTRPTFPLLDLPLELAIKIVEYLDDSHVLLLSLVNRACRSICLQLILPRRSPSMLDRFSTTVYLARDSMDEMACLLGPSLQPIGIIDMDERSPFTRACYSGFDNMQSGPERITTGVMFADRVIVRHVWLETILKYARAWERINVRQKSLLARLLAPPHLAEAPFFAAYVTPFDPESASFTPAHPRQGHDAARAAMQMPFMHFYRVQPKFALRLVMTKDDVGDDCWTVLAKTTWTLTRVPNAIHLRDVNASYSSLQVCPHRCIGSSITSDHLWTLSLDVSNRHFNEVINRIEYPECGRFVATCNLCSTFYSVSSRSREKVEVASVTDLGGQGMPFSNEWLSLTTSDWEGAQFESEKLEKLYDKGTWVISE